MSLLQKQRVREACTTHGLSGGRHGQAHELYYVWRTMHARCRNSRAIGYAYVGARGCTVCAEWATFPGFLRSVAPRPPGARLVRFDPFGDFRPDNVRWVVPRGRRLQ